MVELFGVEGSHLVPRSGSSGMAVADQHAESWIATCPFV